MIYTAATLTSASTSRLKCKTSTKDQVSRLFSNAAVPITKHMHPYPYFPISSHTKARNKSICDNILSLYSKVGHRSFLFQTTDSLMSAIDLILLSPVGTSNYSRCVHNIFSTFFLLHSNHDLPLISSRVKIRFNLPPHLV